MSETYSVNLEKEQLVFSAAHFITYGGNICERLHGHNYRVKCNVFGPLDENGYVVDFIALRDAMVEIVGRLDHRVLLPSGHPTIHVSSDGRETTATFEDRRWVFPDEDCVVLPIENTTAELLARYIGRELISAGKSKFHDAIERIEIAVDENHGQWAVCSLEWA